ncbi:MAG: type II toxin-antitoxin system RelE/ParE family toxin [Clostridiales bacterium]|nr:type II toxin-antitoxin system RelE/ParE family toxin [Clostridiales bacterium]
MKWKIVYSENALKDLKAIYRYIALELCAPKAAEGQVERILSGVRLLSEMPDRHPVYDLEPMKLKEIRSFPINNYVIFYRLKKEIKTVSIIRIIYGGRDIEKQIPDSDGNPD